MPAKGEANVPKGWKRVRLGDVARERNQRAHSAERIFSVTKHAGFVPSLEYFNRQVFSRNTSNYKVVHHGDLAYATIHLDEGSLGILLEAEIGAISPMYTVFEADVEQVEPKFLFATLKLPQMVSKYKRLGEGTVHRRKSISFERLSALSFAIPDVQEQRRVIAVLDSIDGAIEGAGAVIAATEQLRDSLLHDLLTRGLPGQHTEFCDVPGLGTIPADWDVVRLGDVCESPQYGATAPGQPYDPDLPRYVRITDLTYDGRLKAEDSRSAEPSRVVGYELRSGDLLFARSGATVGKTYMYREKDGPCVYAGYLIRFRPKPNLVLPDYLEYCTRSQFYGQWVFSMLRAGAQPNINAAEYSSLTIPLPPFAEQRAIASALEGLQSAIEVAREELAGLRLLKDSTADALLTGRVRVATEGCNE